MAEAKDKEKNDDKAPIIIIKKVKKVAGGHHGGAWKVAYADFVTAMMAFFLLMWLLGMTDEITKKGLSEYFSPNVVSASKSGAGGILGGQEISEEGSLNEDDEVLASDEKIEVESRAGQFKIKALNVEDLESFNDAKDEIRKKIFKNSALKELKENLIIDMTHEGLRIQIIDKEGKPMFKPGSPIPLPHTIQFIKAITEIIKILPNNISLRGHTDSSTYSAKATYTNWELSADRANATRKIMKTAKFPVDQFKDIQGKADREHFDIMNPMAATNRRVTIMVLKQSTEYKEKIAKIRAENARRNRKKVFRKKREKGVIYFP